jgi:hypothetical protein
VDLADGYYRIPLSATTALSLAVVIPNDLAGPPLIAIPLTLPMGWAHSPPFFCSFTETVTDIVNATTPDNFTTHHLLAASQDHQLPQPAHFTDAAIALGTHRLPPIAFTDVYIDDFMIVAQRPRHITTLNKLLHTIDTVFHDHPDLPRGPVISHSKLTKGDMAFSTQKQLLGWLVDTQALTIALPPHRLENMTTLLNTMLAQRRTSTRKWKQLLGTLRSTTPAL